MSDPRVSIIVPVLRADRRYFQLALDSLVQQTFRDFEVIVVEDPSPAPIADLVETVDDPRFKVVRNSSAAGLSRQHNLGLSIGRGAFLCRFDSDDVCEPGKVEAQIRFLDEHPDLDVVGTNLLVIDQNDRVIGERRYPAEHEAIMATFPRWNPVANPTVMFRREVFERFGGWDETRTDPAQDYEWFSRIARGGARFANLQQPLVRYRVHSRSIKRRQLHGTLRTTIRVKRKYWREALGARGQLILLAERLMLLLPSTLVYRLFIRLRYR